MEFLDPADCKAARDCLCQGNPVEAAQILLQSRHKGHRAARQLLLEISRELAGLAGDA